MRALKSIVRLVLGPLYCWAAMTEAGIARASVGGRLITMREPNFSESLQFSEALQPLLAELVGGGPRTIAALTRVMHRHRGALFPLIAQCAGVGTAWIEEIGDVEGKKLALLFWKVNASFFGRLLVQTQAGTEGA